MSLEGWQSITNDYSKTIITLSSAFLAFTVTFWDNVLPPSIQDTWFWLLILIWVFLIVAIASALFAAGLLVRLLLRKGTRRRLMCAANLSYFAFGLASLLFLALGAIAQFAEAPWTDADALALARTVLDESDSGDTGDWRFVSMNVSGDSHAAFFVDEANTRSATVSVSKLDGCLVVTLRKLVNAPGQPTQVGLEKTEFAKKC
jgi:MFS family permease